MKHNNENLEQLLQQFVDETQAQKMMDDIHEADRLFDAHPAPAVDADTLEALRHSVRHQVKRHHRRHARRHWVGIAAIAAVLLVGLFTMYSGDPDSPIHTTTPIEKVAHAPAGSMLDVLDVTPWALNDNPLDALLAEIRSELGNLADAINTMDTGTYEPVNPLRFELIELEELEAVADSSEFWKG